MKNNQQFYKPVFLGIIFLFMCGCFITTIGIPDVFAEEGDGTEDSGNSGGFMIESEKVEGEMDVLGSLQGKINIEEGKIYGLTITKKLDMGKNQNAMIIKIKSPGPVPVKELESETIGGGPPSFSGLCAPSKIGWACLQDVKMTVPSQSVSDISLPDAKIETCYESECDALPDESAVSKKDMQNMLEEMEEQQLTLQEIKDGLEEDKEQLKTIKELLDQATTAYKQMKEDGQPEKLEQSVDDISKLLNEQISAEEENKEELDEEFVEQFVVLTEQTGKDYTSLNETTTEFVKTLDEASKLVKELEEHIKLKENSLAKIEEEAKKQAKDKDRKQAEDYAALKEKAEESSASNEADKKAKKTDGKETKASEEKEEAIVIPDLKEQLKAFKEEVQAENKRLRELKVKQEELIQWVDTITKSLTELKTTIVKVKENFPDEVFEKIMEHLKAIEIDEKELENKDSPDNDNKEKQPKENGDNDKTGNTNKKGDEDEDKAENDDPDKKGNQKPEPAAKENSSGKEADKEKDKEENGVLLNEVTDLTDELFDNTS